MKMESAIRLWAGTILLVSLALGYLHSPYWHLLTAFVGINLIQSALTGFCPAEKLLAKLGVSNAEKEEAQSCCSSRF